MGLVGDCAKIQPSHYSQWHLVRDHAHGMVDLEASQHSRLRKPAALGGLPAGHDEG
jgi:hypothetical protein